MMQPVLANGADTRRVGDEFVELVLADHDWLLAEFEEIIATEWPDWPPNAPPQRVLRGHPEPKRPKGLDDTTTTTVPRPRRAWVMRRSARQRSPPGPAAMPLVRELSSALPICPGREASPVGDILSGPVR